MKKKLSFVIPTLNRLELLEITLNHLLPQIERNLEQVEFLISINASNDKTADYVEELSKTKSFVQYKNFENRVGICESFARSIEMCTGEFVILYGDDDIPSTYLVENILDVLHSNPNIGLVHFNRLVGSNLTNFEMNKLRLEEAVYKTPYEVSDLGDFIYKYSMSPGFVSSMVFKRECWELGSDIDNSTHYGWEFLSRIYAGIHKLDSPKCLYINYPLLIQRLIKTREWNDMWPKYWLVGVPNLLNTLDKEKITKNVVDTWYNKLDKSTIKYIYYLLWASSYKNIYRPLISEINKNQNSTFRKLLAVIIILFAPKFVFETIRKYLYKQ